MIFRCTAWSNLNLNRRSEEKKPTQIFVGFYCHWYYICLLLGIVTICNAMHTHINFHGLISWLGGSTVSNILDAKWSASWNESCFFAFTSKRNLCSAPLTALNNFCQQFGSTNHLVLIFYLLTPRSHSLVFLPRCASSELVSLERMWKNGRRFGILHRLVQPVQPATQRAHNMVRTWANLEAGGQSGEEIWITCMAWWTLDSKGSKWNFTLSNILNKYAKLW